MKAVISEVPQSLLDQRARTDIDRNEYFEAAPTAVIEIRSPGDETMDKIPFYARLGVPELWIIDRDTKAPELYVLQEGRYQQQPPNTDGWLQSPATGIRLRKEPDNKLAFQIGDDETARHVLPDG